jgi:transcription elongation factor GreB
VEVREDTGDVQAYRIVGPDETDAKTSSISMDSPLAKALLARHVGDEVALTTNGKSNTMCVVSIRY